MKKLLFTLFSLAIIGIACLSCKIGLGQAVDTQPPEVKITTPEVGAVIRDAFIIGGTWTDDGSIKSEGGLLVSLERTDDSGEKVDYYGKVGDGDWSCVIDPLNNIIPLRDGEYQATITMTDTYEHETVKTVTFTIDNTAPIVVLQRPSAKIGDSKPDSYGQTFSLTGQAADDNDINSIDVSLYADESCETWLHTVHLDNVPPTIELDVAKFADGVENDYSKIYGSTSKVGTKQFYCQIVAYDGAQRYPIDGSAQTESDKLGNSTNHYYLYEEISGSILNHYKITEVYHMNNGSYVGEAESRAAIISSVKEILSEHEIRIGSFTLNPANNPTYTVSGRNPLVCDGHDFDTDRITDLEISNGSKVQIEVATGLDGITIKGDTLGVYVIECDNEGNPVAGAEKKYIIEPKAAKDGTQLITDEAAIDARSSLIGKSGTSYKLTVALDAAVVPGLSFGGHYIFGVDGYDENNAEVADFGNIYGFCFVSSGSAPKVEVSNPANGITYLGKDNSLNVTGYAQADLSYPNITVKIADTNGNSLYTKDYNSAGIASGTYGSEITTSSPNDKKRADFNHTIPASAFSQTTSTQYSLIVSASNGEKDTTIERTIMYDIAGPIVSIEEISPIAQLYKVAGDGNYTRENEYPDSGNGSLYYSGDYLNGTVTLKLSMSDEYDVVNTTDADYKPYFEIVNSSGVAQDIKVVGASSTAKKVYLTTPAKEIVNIDTTNLSGDITLKVHGWDRAHNKGAVATKALKVDQLTDKPVILPDGASSFTLTFDNKDEFSNNPDKLNVLSAGSSMGIKLIDDDGIQNYKFYRSEKDQTTLNSIPTETPQNGPKSLTYYYGLPTDQGKYKCKIEVTDINGITNEKTFFIMVTGAAPSLTADYEPADKIITTASSNTETGAKKILISTLHVTSTEFPFNVKRYYHKLDWKDPNDHSKGQEPKPSPLPLSTTYEYGGVSLDLTQHPNTTDYIDPSFMPPADRCDNIVIYEFEDKNGNKGSIEITYYVDSTPPTIDVSSIVVPDVDATESPSHRFTASSNDVAGTDGNRGEEQKVSGVNKIQYTFDSNKAEGNIETINGTTSLSSVFVFNQTPNLGFNHAVEGPKKIYIRAIDAVGNIGAWAEKEFVYDTSKPVVGVTSYTPNGGSAITTVPTTFEVNELFKLEGTANDNYGIAEVKITETKAGGDSKDITPTLENNNKTWTVAALPHEDNRDTNGKPLSGSYVYKITAKDLAGKTAEKTITVNIDRTAPTVTITDPAAQSGDPVLSGNSTAFVGKVHDGNDTVNKGVACLYWAIDRSEGTSGSTNWVLKDFTTDSYAEQTWDFSRSLDTGSKASVTSIAGGDNNKIPEGLWYVHVKAVDKAGNVSEVASKKFYVDQGAPEIKNLKASDLTGTPALSETITYYNSSDQSLKVSGTIKESNEFEKFVAKVNGGSEINIKTGTDLSALVSTIDKDWDYTFTNLPKDAENEIEITAKDKVTRSTYTTKTIKIYNDTAAPTIDITVPASDDTTGKFAIEEATSFSATVTELGSGLKNNYYWYKFSQTEMNDAAIKTDFTNNATTWSHSEAKKSVLTKSMGVKAGTTDDLSNGKLCEGRWFFYIYAVDNVGNIKTEKREFWVDLANPTVKFNINEGSDTGASTFTEDDEYDFTNTPDVRNATFDVYYKVSDTFEMDATDPVEVVVKQGKKADTTLVRDTGYTVETANTNGYCKIALISPVDDEYTFIIKAKDKVGKTTTVTHKIRLDTTPPALTVTTPNFTSWSKANSVTVSGKIVEATETRAVYYKVDSTESTLPSQENFTEAYLSTAANGWTKTTNNDLDFTVEENDGQYKLYIAAVDTVGNVTKVADVITKDLKIDATLPVVTGDTTELKVLAGTSSVTLSGTYTEETSKPAAVKVKATRTDVTQNTSQEFTGTWDESTGTWTSTMSLGTGTGKLEDGKYTFTVTMTDNAGNAGTYTRTAIIDTTKPSIGDISLPNPAQTDSLKKYTDSDSHIWYNSSSLNITIDGVKDDPTTTNGYASGAVSGLTVEYQVTYPGITDSPWISMEEGTGNTYNANVNLPVQGQNTIKIRVKDFAGNEAGAVKSQDVYVDTAAPLMPAVEKDQNGVEIPAWWVNGQANFNSQILSNKRNNVTVHVIPKDANSDVEYKSSGIKSVKLKGATKSAAATKETYESKETYKLIIDKDDIANGSCTIIIEDNVGKTTEWSPFSFAVDTTAPKVAINTINDADSETAGTQVNKKFNLAGTGSDNRQVNQLDICYYYDNKWTNIYSTTTADDIFNWTKEIDTVKSATCTFGNTTDMNGKEVTFCVIITDEAGNRNLDTGTTTITDNTTVVTGTTKRIPTQTPDQIAADNKATVKINQDSDRPIVKISNFSLKGMESSKSVYLTGLGTIFGIVSDDDGVDKLYYRTKLASATDFGDWSSELTIKDGQFSIPSLSDGNQVFQFKIKDKAGNTFESSAEDALKKIKLWDSDSTVNKFNDSPVLYVRVDTKTPTIGLCTLDSYSESSGGTATSEKDSLSASTTVGGVTKKYIEITAKATDANGIKGMTIELADSASNPVEKYLRSNGNVTIDGISAYDDTGSVTATDDSTEYEWTTGRIDLSGFADGLINVTITAIDNAGQTLPNSYQFKVDNTAPTFNITQPKADITKDTDAIFGVQTQTVGGDTGSSTDIDKIYYAVTKDTAEPTTWIEVKDVITNASIVFDGGTDKNHAPKFHDQIATVISQAAADADDTQTLYVWFKPVDKCGNSSTSKRQIKVIPNGDKPSVAFSFPSEDGSIMSGTIRMNGTVEQPISEPDSVWYQIDTNYTGTFNESWKTGFVDCCSGKDTNYVIETFANGKQGIKATGTRNWSVVLNQFKELNNGDQSRSVAIRVYAKSEGGKLSDPFVRTFTVDPNAPHIGGEKTGEVPLQVVQFDSDSNVGDFNHIVARKTYTNEMWLTGKWYLIASVSDDAGISELTIENKNTTDAAKKLITENTGKTAYEVASDLTFDEVTCQIKENTSLSHTSPKGKNWNICIPLKTGSGSGTIRYKLEATEIADTTPNSCTQDIVIYYDNTAPKISLTDHDGYNISPDVKQDNGYYTLSGYVSDSDSSPNAKVSGRQSVVFYFVRRGSKAGSDGKITTRVYDPMWKNKSVVIREGAPTDANGTNASDIVYNNGLYWQTKTVTRGENPSVLTVTGGTGDFIHKGGYAQLGGSIYKITDVTSTTVTVDGTPPTALTTAYFALGLVVDNYKAESKSDRDQITDSSKYGYGYYSANSANDDGDLMEESWSGTDNEGKWTALINSANIPDGLIEIHYVAFDNAWNYSVGIVGNVDENTYKTYKTLDVTANEDETTGLRKANTNDTQNKLASRFVYAFGTTSNATQGAYISNNAPRIVGVTVGTDYDGDGTISATEKESKYVGEANLTIGGTIVKGAKTKVKDLAKLFNASTTGNASGKAWFTIKDKSSVQIEIVGGNNDLYLWYAMDGLTYKDHQTTANYYTKYGTNGKLTVTRNTAEGDAQDDNDAAYIKTTKLSAVEFSKDAIRGLITSKENSTINAPTWFTFEIWDSTEEETPFVDSQYAELKLPIAIDVFDKTPPQTYINDLYWKSATDNSVAQDANGKLLGHVELKKDLNNTQLKTTYGADDKVSGKVVFRGTAYDNIRLAKLEWAIVSSDGKTSLLPYTVANSLTYTTGATFGKETGEETATWKNKSGTGWDFKVYSTVDATQGRTANDIYLGSAGHKVMWELTVDTSYINGVVAENAKVYVRATDTSVDNTGDKPYTTTMTGTGTTVDANKMADKANLPTYQVDILPYITGVETRMARLKQSKGNARSALGHYQIASNEEAIELSGYNLAAQSAFVTIAKTDVANIASGGYAYTVSGSITSINNMNDNEAKGDYSATSGVSDENKVKNMYNRQPDTQNNLNLTDDVIFDVWDIKTAAKSVDGTSIYEPVMKINPANGKVGFAFGSGADSFCMNTTSGDNTSSYTVYSKNYTKFNNIAMDYDKNGNSHSICVGLDTNDGGYAGRMTYMTSLWGIGGTSHTNDNFAQDNKLRIDCIGIPENDYKLGEKLNNYILDDTRFGHPTMKVVDHVTNDKTNYIVYLAYYDNLTKQIRFRTAENGGIVNRVKLNQTNNVTNNCSIQNTNRLSIGTNNVTPFNNGDDITLLDSNSYIIGTIRLTNGRQQSGGGTRYYYYTFDNAQWEPGKGTGDVNKAIRTSDIVESNKQNDPIINAASNTRTVFGMFDDPFPDETSGNVSWGNHPCRTIDTQYYSLIAGAETNESIDNADYVPSKYVSIDAVPGNTSADDKVVVVFTADDNIYYTYRRGDKTVDSNVEDGGNDYWSDPVLIEESCGAYCTIKADPSGAVHIAYYDDSDGALKYAYFSNYANTTFRSAKVDGYQISGSNISIDFVKKGNYYIPYISYFSNSQNKSKVAYLDKGERLASGVLDGADDDDRYTGVWEVAIIPTSAKVQDENTSIGFYKDTDYTAKKIPTATASVEATSGTCGGNNSSYPMIAYKVEDKMGIQTLEVAQRK